MPSTQLAVSTCIEHERLEFELIEIRPRGRYLTRLRFSGVGPAGGYSALEFSGS